MGSHSVTFHPTQVSTLRLHPSHSGRYSIYLPQRDGRLSWPRWLVSCYIPRWFTRPQMVTHPSTNRARCRLTSLIKPMPLTTTPCRHSCVCICVKVIQYVGMLLVSGWFCSVCDWCDSRASMVVGCDHCCRRAAIGSHHRLLLHVHQQGESSYNSQNESIKLTPWYSELYSMATKRISWIFHVLKINRMMPFCSLFMGWPSYVWSAG